MIVSKKEIDDIITCKHMAIENLLKKLYEKIQKYRPNIQEENLQNLQNFQNFEAQQDSPVKVSVNNNQFNQPEYNNIGDSSKDQFYRQQIIERDSVIEELKQALEVAELKMKKSEEDKSFLNSKLKEYTNAARQYGLI